MHTDLTPHLHTEECNRLIENLKKCHAENKFGRFLGFCNDADKLMVRCLRDEREANRKANFEKSRAKQMKQKADQE